MLIRFTSPAGSSVSMFEKDAKALIKMMGHSGAIPSAIRGEDVADALGKLQAALHLQAQQNQPPKNEPSQPEHEETEKPVSINVRAYPLMELLKAADASKKNVMWEYEQQFF